MKPTITQPSSIESKDIIEWNNNSGTKNVNEDAMYDVTYYDADFEDEMAAENERQEKEEENKERTNKATEERN